MTVAFDSIERALSNKADPNRKLIKNGNFSYELQGLGQAVQRGSNTIIAAPGIDTKGVQFLRDAENCVVIISKMRQFKARMVISGSDHVAYLGRTKKFQGAITIRGNRNFFMFSDQSTCNNAGFVMSGDDKSIAFGADCMLSFLITVRNTDSHGIISLEDRQVINPAKSVLVNPHVWVGERAQILSGAVIGKGSIIGANATVAGEVPHSSIAVGIPAKVIKSGVSWHRKEHPDEEEIDELCDALADVPRSALGGLRDKLFGGQKPSLHPAFSRDDLDMELEGGIGTALHDE